MRTQWRHIGMTLALLGAFGAVILHTSPAQACGIGQTATMTADGDPALAFPLNAATTTTNAPLGLFARDYAANHSITFTEDLAQLPTTLDPANYTWQWDFGDGATATGFTVTHAFAQTGAYTVHVSVRSQAGTPVASFDSAQIAITLQVASDPPTVTAHASTAYVQVGGAVTYDATGSTSAPGPLTYTWNFGDGATAIGAHVTHRFTTLGAGNVTVIAQDVRGARSYATTPVTIVPQLPTVKLHASADSVAAGDALTFTATDAVAPSDRPDNRIVAYTWDFGDGVTFTTTAPNATHRFTTSGSYHVTVQALDRRNIPGASSLTVTVGPALFAAANRELLALTLLGGLLALASLAVLGRGVWRATRRPTAA